MQEQSLSADLASDDDRLTQMRQLVGSGQSVTQAILQVYGCRRSYYDSITPAERQTVYCKPKPVAGFRQIKVKVNASRANDLEALAKAEGLTVTRLVNQLIVERLTLTRQAQSSENHVGD